MDRSHWPAEHEVYIVDFKSTVTVQFADHPPTCLWMCLGVGAEALGAGEEWHCAPAQAHFHALARCTHTCTTCQNVSASPWGWESAGHEQLCLQHQNEYHLHELSACAVVVGQVVQGQPHGMACCRLWNAFRIDIISWLFFLRLFSCHTLC